MVKAVESKLNFPIWLNADIIAGPGGGAPVDADQFLALCSDYMPGSDIAPIQGVPKKTVICGKWSVRATGLSKNKI